MSSEQSTPPVSPMAARFRGYLPVVVDVEAGGFNCRTDALLEIAAVILAMDDNGNIYPAESHSFHVDPFEGANLEQSALDFTGIDPWDPSREAVPEMEAMNELFRPIRKALKEQACKRAILVGHNAIFDHNFLSEAVNRADIKRNPFHPFSTFDTVSLAGLALGQTVLAHACLKAGIEFSNREAHSALYDAQKTAELFCLIVNRWKDLGGWPLALAEGEDEGDNAGAESEPQ